jgi:hypothetical protein
MKVNEIVLREHEQNPVDKDNDSYANSDDHSTPSASPDINGGRQRLEPSAISALPGARRWDDLDNSSPYHAFRFGIALAGAPDIHMPLDGAIGQKMMTIAYTDADRKILDAAGKSLGFSGSRLSADISHELPDTYTQSPMRPQGPVKPKNRTTTSASRSGRSGSGSNTSGSGRSGSGA